MEYKVSEQVRQKFDALVKDEKVQKALKFMEEDQDAVIDRQIELTLNPAPPPTMSRRRQNGCWKCSRKRDFPTVTLTNTEVCAAAYP